MSKGTNRNLDARITLEQLLAPYTNPESHNAQRHRQTDGRTDGQTDGQQAYANSRSYCVAVRSANKWKYRNIANYFIPHTRMTFGDGAFSEAGSVTCNSLPAAFSSRRQFAFFLVQTQITSLAVF